MKTNFSGYRQTVCLLFLILSITGSLRSQAVSTTVEDGYVTKKDIPYYDPLLQPAGEAATRLCKLDIYYPVRQRNFSTIVWFHGGALEFGEKTFPEELLNQGVAIVSVDYRLSPESKCPSYLEDAAAAVAWTYRHVSEYGGDTTKIFIAGHSAGGYLTLMLGLDKHWLARHAIDADQLAGIIPLSGQTMTHYTIRKERKLPMARPVVDEYAPVFHARNEAPPMLLVTGDRSMEQTSRYEENAYLVTLLKAAGHAHVTLYEVQGFDHVGMVKPGTLLLLQFVRNQKQ
jgi:acetyl esterase/lipase